jgi:hypothetical protein
LYRPSDVALLEQINDLLHRQHYTIKGAVAFLQKGGVAEAPATVLAMAVSAPASSSPEMTFVRDELQRIRSRLVAALDAA